MIKNRSKPVLTQAWVNDAAYFDGTGFAEIVSTEDTSRQRYEQEVKLLSHNGVLLLLQSGVKTSLVHLFIILFSSYLQLLLDMHDTLSMFVMTQPF